MIVSITEFSTIATDSNGQAVPLGHGRTACNVRTVVGAFPALGRDTKIIRVATDTNIRMDITGGTTDTADELFLAGVEYLSVNGLEVLTIA